MARKSEPFGEARLIEVRVPSAKRGRDRKIKMKIGGPPKKLTRPLRRHLRVVRRQNAPEAERQLALLGLKLEALKRG